MGAFHEPAENEQQNLLDTKFCCDIYFCHNILNKSYYTLLRTNGENVLIIQPYNQHELNNIFKDFECKLMFSFK